MSRRRQRLCVTPSKVRYEDFEAAQLAYERELTEPGRTNPSSWAYYCEACHCWHRTHRRDPGLGGRDLIPPGLRK